MKLKVTIPKTSLLLLAKDIVNTIHDNTLAGKDKDGKPFKKYSSNPFAMPSGAATKRAIDSLDKSGGLVWFTTKDKAKWVVIKDGYKALKTALRPGDGGKVNLSLTGDMLNDMDVIAIGTNEVRIGFNREENAQKALWNIENDRDFFGIPDSEFKRLTKKHIGDGVKIEVIK